MKLSKQKPELLRTDWNISKVNHLMFPTDFSHHAEHAMQYAIAFAKDLGATLHIVHIYDTTFHGQTQSFETRAERHTGHSIQDEIEAKVYRLADEAREAGIEAEPHWRKGDICDEILRLSHVLETSLIVMSTHAREPWAQSGLVSKYRNFIRKADVPVIAIKHPEHEFLMPSKHTLSMRRILCPCDLTAFSHSAVPIAANVCRHFQAELILGHIAHSYEEYLALEGLAGKPAERVDTYEVLNHIAEEVKDVATRIIVKKGNPKTDVHDLCKDENVDLVVMTMHSRGLVRSIVGSIAEELVLDSPCPVMTVRPDRIAARFPPLT